MRAALLALLAALAACGSGEPAPGVTPVQVARKYVEARLRGDGSHGALEFGAELPELLRRHSQTSPLPEGAALATFELQTVGVTGPGSVPELSEWAFDVTEGPERAQGILALAVVYTARLEDGELLTNRVVELRPADSFEPRPAPVSSAADYAGTWKVLPPAR